MVRSWKKELYSFFHKDTTSLPTHYTFSTPCRNLSIDYNKFTDFFLTYCKIVNDNLPEISIGEKIGSHLPVVCDCILYFTNDDNLDDIKDNNFVLILVHCYQQAIIKYLKVSTNQCELDCCVMESIDIKQKKYHIRLLFPRCRTTPTIQKDFIYNEVIGYLHHQNPFQVFNSQPIGSWNEIIDKNVVDNAWPMYLRIKTSGDIPPKLSYILGKISDELVGVEDICGLSFDDYPMIDNCFNVQDSSFVRKKLINEDIFSKLDAGYLLPIFLSINFYDNHTESKDVIDNVVPNGSQQQSRIDRIRDNTDIDLAYTFLSMIDSSRCHQKHCWYDIGRALYTCSKGEQDGLNMWLEFSKVDDSIDLEQCQLIYPSFRDNNPITVKTLAWYARNDSSDEYYQWMWGWLQPVLNNACDLTHTSVAKALYRYYWLDISCSSVQYKKWYLFKNHCWMLMDSAGEFRTIISNDFVHRIEEYQVELTRAKYESVDQDFKIRADANLTRVGMLIKILKNVKYKNSLIVESMEHFKDPRFSSYENKNPNLKVLINGVIETVDQKATFREGKPEDFMTKRAQIYWDPTLNWDSYNVIEFMEWMTQCFPDLELRRYFLKFMASCLYTGNRDKIFAIFTGSGNNSKSKIKKLFGYVFGSYCIDFPTSLFTGKRTGSSSATPELAQAKDASVAFIQETGKDENINGGILKEFTGGDSFFARLLHDNGGKMEATFKLILQCNDPPSIHGADEAIRNRLRIFPFLSTWSMNYPHDKNEQLRQRIFPMDKDFDLKVCKLAPAALWVIVQMYTDYCKEDITPPTIAVEYTEQYWKEHDIYNSFTRDCIITAIVPDSVTDQHPTGVRDVTSLLTILDVYPEFKIWFSEAYPQRKIPDRETVRLELTRRWGKPNANGWHGIKHIERMAII